MKMISGLFALAFCGMALAYSYSQIGDVTIFSNSTHFQCDRLFCPPEAQLCQVIKTPSPQNANSFLRQNFCYAAGSNVPILNYTQVEQVDPQWPQSQLNVNAYRNGGSSSVQSSNGNWDSSSVQASGGTWDSSQVITGHPIALDVQNQLDLQLGQVHRITQNIQSQVDQFNNNLQQRLQQMQQQLQAAYGRRR